MPADILSTWIQDPFENYNRDEHGNIKQCELMDNIAITIQVILGILSFLSLFVKRHLEVPKRSFRIFTLDITKQLCGALWQHILNVGLAVYLQLKVNKGNGCDWYFINFICEIFFSVALTISMQSIISHYAEKYDILILQSGVYLSIHDAQYIYRYTYEDLDKHINYKVWFIQLVIWIMIVTISKLTVFGLEYYFADEIITIGINILLVFYGHPVIELIVVMMIVPFVLNCVQYWVQDNVLRGTDFIES